MYQWGRKDGFPGADGSTILPDGNTGSVTINLHGADGSTALTEDVDGYCKVDISAEGVLNENNTLSYSIQHPLHFIMGNSDWYVLDATYQNDLLWGDNNIKGTYDPCPRGWRVPTDGTWNDFSVITFPYYIQGNQTTDGGYTETNGRQYNHMTWYPASGYRDYEEGTLYSVGRNGYYLTITVDDTSINSLRFYMANGISLNRSGLRTPGFSVRCVQE